MKLSHLLSVGAAVGAFFGIAFVLAPGPVLALYGITLSPGGTVVAQLFGGALMGLGAIDWFARNAQSGEALQAIIMGNLVDNTIGFVVALLGQLAGMANGMGWLIVFIYFWLAVAFAYFQFAKPVAQTGHLGS